MIAPSSAVGEFIVSAPGLWWAGPLPLKPEERERDGHWRRAPPSRLLPRMSQSDREGSQPDVCAEIGLKDFQGATTSAAWPGSLCKLCSPRSAGSQRSARRGALDLLTRRRCLTQPGRGSRHLACTLMARDGRARDRSACRAKDQHQRPTQPREADTQSNSTKSGRREAEAARQPQSMAGPTGRESLTASLRILIHHDTMGCRPPPSS